MNDRKIQLRKRHYEEIKMKHPPLLLSSSGSVFFYSTANGALRLFYSESGKNTKLPHSSFVTSRPSSLCLSPSHAFGLVFFDDGSILLYDLLENKIIKTLSKELKGKVTHSVFLNDTQILVYDDAFQLSVLTLQNYSIFGFAIQKKSLNFYQSFMNQLIVPPTHLAIKEEPNDINYGSFCVSPIFSKVFAFSLSKRIIVVNIPDNSQKLQVIYDIELKNDDLCDRPFISFNLPNPDTLYFSYTTKRRIVVLKIASENLSKSNSNEPKVIFETDLKSPPKFNAFLSSSVVSVICEDDLVYLFSFLEEEKPYSCATLDSLKGILLDFNSKIAVMSPKSLNVYYLHSFYSNFGNLMADDEIEATISLCRKAIAGDEDSSVGLPRNNEIKSLEIERLMYDVLFKFIEFKKDPTKFIKKQQNQSDNQNNENSNENNGVNENNKVNEPNQVNEKYELDENVEFDVKNVVKEVVQLCVELHNREWITHDGLQVFKELGGGLDLINEVLRVDPDAELFNYTPAFVNAVIKGLGYESENAQKERVSHFLIKLPKIVAKPKQIINYALSTNNINLAATVFAEKCHEPIHAMNLFETLGDFQSIVDKVLCLEKNNDFYYVNESSAFRKDVIEWLFTLNKSTFTRLQNSIQISEDKMTNFLLVLLNSDILNSNEEELYLNAILETLSELNIGFNRSIFKIVEQKIIKNCPKKFTRKSIKYLLDSVFSKKEEYLMPDHRETLLCQIVQTVNLPLTLCRKLILYCASFSFDEAEILLLNKLKMYEIIIQKYINEVSQNQNDEDISQENDFKKVYDFIILKYNENDHSMSEIDVALIKNADILASSDPEALINVLYQVNCRILYDSFIEAIKDFETKMVFIYHICIQPFENQKMNRYIVELMPFAAKNFQCECLSILRKYPDGITNPSIVKAFDQFGMYDCCAFAQARLHDHIEARRYIRMLINTLQMPTTYPNNLTEQSFRNEQNNLNDQNSKNSVSAVIYEVCIHLFNLTCFPIETRTQDLHYILKSFALLFTEKENISVATAAYRLVCDAAESFLPFEDILEYSKKIYMNVLDEEKFLRLVRHLMLGRKYNAESAIKLKEFLIQYLAQNTDKENNSDENSSGISKFEEEANELKCGKCHVKLIVEGKGINIFWCGHAVHDIEYCNKAGNCPLCQKAVSLQ